MLFCCNIAFVKITAFWNVIRNFYNTLETCHVSHIMSTSYPMLQNSKLTNKMVVIGFFLNYLGLTCFDIGRWWLVIRMKFSKYLLDISRIINITMGIDLFLLQFKTCFSNYFSNGVWYNEFWSNLIMLTQTKISQHSWSSKYYAISCIICGQGGDIYHPIEIPNCLGPHL